MRLLNGDPLPKLVPGIMPYPVALVPNVAVTAETLRSHELDTYDLPPPGWTPPNLQ